MGTTPDPTGPEVAAEEEESSYGEVSLTRIQVLNLCFTAAAAVLSMLLSVRFALGVVIGGLLMAANFRVIVGVVRSVFLYGSANVLSVGIYWAKFALLMLAVGILVLVFRVDAIGFLVGLSIILVAITTEAVLRLVGK